MDSAGTVESISAITLATHDMARAVRFYRALGFEIIYGGETAAFTSFRAGSGYLNLITQAPETQWSWWGRVIFYHSDVDALHAAMSEVVDTAGVSVGSNSRKIFISPHCHTPGQARA